MQAEYIVSTAQLHCVFHAADLITIISTDIRLS